MYIYPPAEDSYLLQKSLKDYLKGGSLSLKVLDMGSGSGIQARTCKDLGIKEVLAVDVNSDAVKGLKEEGLHAIRSDLFSEVPKSEKFDLIIFNPPYLPEDKREPKDSRLATTGGEKGYELILKFLKQAKDYLNKDGKILLLFSSLSKPRIIKNKAGVLGYSFKELDKSFHFFETLFVFELSILN